MTADRYSRSRYYSVADLLGDALAVARDIVDTLAAPHSPAGDVACQALRAERLVQVSLQALGPAGEPAVTDALDRAEVLLSQLRTDVEPYLLATSFPLRLMAGRAVAALVESLRLSSQCSSNAEVSP